MTHQTGSSDNSNSSDSKVIDIRNEKYSHVTSSQPKQKADAVTPASALNTKPPREHGGPRGPEPTRYGDWERNGRCSDF